MYLFKIFFICLIFVSLGLGAITSTRYTLPDPNYTRLWDGTGRDNKGNMYFAVGWYEWQYDDPDKNCKIYRFNFNTNGFDVMGTVKDASERMDNWVTAAEANYPANPFDAPGKIHTSFHPYKGKVYCATHASCDMPTFTEDIDTYAKFFRGAHLYSVDENTGTILDCNGFRKNVFAPENGIMDVGIDYHHNGVYGIGYPTGKVFYHDLNTGISHHEVWQTMQGIPMRDAGAITRNMIVDNEGRAWFYAGFGLMGWSFHTNDTIIIPLPPGHIGWNGHFSAVAHSVTRDSIYFIDIGKEEIFRLRVKARALDYITDVTGKLLAIRWDQEKLYYINSGLKSYHMRTGFIQSYSVGGSGLSGANYGSGNPVDKNGDIWMTRSDGTQRGLLRIRLDDPCAICATEVWDYGDPPVTARPSAPVHKDLELTVSPNPFSTSVNIQVLKPNSEFGMTNMEIGIYDVTGKQVHSAFSNRHSALTWYAANQSNGLYIVKVTAGNKVMTKRVTLVR
jgi:hypothetical protein